MKASHSILVGNLVRSAAVLLLCATLSPLLRANRESWSAEQKEVWKNVETYWALGAAGDTKGWQEYMHADYQGWAYDNPLPGSRERTIKFVAHFHRTSKTLVSDLQPVTVRVFGEMAYVHYFYTEITKDAEGKEKRQSGRWTDILKKQGNKWVMVADHGGELPPKP